MKYYLLVSLLKKYNGYQFWLMPRFISLCLNFPSYKKEFFGLKKWRSLELINEITLLL